MDFLSFLQEIGAAKYFDIKAAAADGGCAIMFNGNLEVTFEHDEKTQALVVFSPVLSLGDWPVESRARILSQVMELHLFGIATDGNYFGFDSQLNRIIFFRNIALGQLDATQAVQAVESFVNQLERWQPQIAQASVKQDAADPAPAAAIDSSQFPIQRA